MKKTVSILLLAAVFALTFSACGAYKVSKKTPDGTEEPTLPMNLGEYLIYFYEK